MAFEVEKIATPETRANEQLRRIAQEIRKLEGLPVDFRLAQELSQLLKDLTARYGY